MGRRNGKTLKYIIFIGNYTSCLFDQFVAIKSPDNYSIAVIRVFYLCFGTKNSVVIFAAFHIKCSFHIPVSYLPSHNPWRLQYSMADTNSSPASKVNSAAGFSPGASLAIWPPFFVLIAINVM